MTMIPVVPSTFAQLLIATRKELDDRNDDNLNNPRDVSTLRYTDFDLIDAVNDALIKLGNMMALAHSGEALVYTDFTYTADSNTPMDLPGAPSTLLANQIFGVYGIQDPNNPINIQYITPKEFLDKVKSNNPSPTVSRKFYTLVGSPSNSATVGGGIMIGPSATSLPVRVWYVQTPFIDYVSPDTPGPDLTLSPLLASRWREVIALKAAEILMSRNNEFNQGLQIRLADAMKDFIAWSNRQHGPRRMRLVNRPF